MKVFKCNIEERELKLWIEEVIRWLLVLLNGDEISFDDLIVVWFEERMF